MTPQTSYARDSVNMISVKPVTELAYPCSDLHDVSIRVGRGENVILGAPYQTEQIPFDYVGQNVRNGLMDASCVQTDPSVKQRQIR